MALTYVFLNEERQAIEAARLEEGKRNERIRASFQREFGNRCPCCNALMSVTGASGAKRTKGHDKSRPSVERGTVRLWIYICSLCNRHQGGMSFIEWMAHCYSKGDYRWKRIKRVCEIIELTE